MSKNLALLISKKVVRNKAHHSTGVKGMKAILIIILVIATLCAGVTVSEGISLCNNKRAASIELMLILTGLAVMLVVIVLLSVIIA